jgi:hypothetical protein
MEENKESGLKKLNKISYSARPIFDIPITRSTPLKKKACFDESLNFLSERISSTKLES